MAAVDPGEEEKTIRRLDAEWGDAGSRHDLDAVIGFYASDGSLVWPDAPAVHGIDEIRVAWSGMFAQIKGLTLKFVPERIVIADGGEMASDFGKVLMGQDTASGHEVITAKYVVVWRKMDGAWKVLYDSYNLNTPGPPCP